MNDKIERFKMERTPFEYDSDGKECNTEFGVWICKNPDDDKEPYDLECFFDMVLDDRFGDVSYIVINNIRNQNANMTVHYR